MPTTERNKNILVLGATSDIAMSLIHLLIYSWHNCKFYLLARDISKLQDLKNEAEKNNHQVKLIHYDLLKPTEISFHNINYYIVLAGWFPNGKSEAEKTLQVNFTGIKEFTEKLITENQQYLEHILITGSVAGVRRRNLNKDYGIAKQLLHEYTIQTQKNPNFNFKTTLVIPGYVNTKMTAGLKLNRNLMIEHQKLATKYLVWMDKKPKEIYSQPIWHLIAIVLKMIPEFIMKRLNF